MSDEIRTAQTSSTGVPVAVMGWPADLGACGTYRVSLPLRMLAQKHGVQAEMGSMSTQPYTILVAQRTNGKEQVDFLKRVKENRQAYNEVSIPKIVYELDDDLWSVEPDNPAYDHYMTDGRLARVAEAAGLADLVTVSTSTLAEVVKQYNDNVVVLPNSVPERLLNEAVFPYTTGSFDKPYVIGWAGSPTHLSDFKMCVGGLNTLLRLNQNTRMVFFGTDYSYLLDPSVRGQCRVAPWTKTVVEYHNLLGAAQIDVMLAPLYPSKFNLSKSNLRLIEANALGIPVIATEYGPYAEGSPGTRLVKPGESWLPALNELSNGMLRLDMSSKGREWVANNYTIEANCDLWLDAYKGVLNA